MKTSFTFNRTFSATIPFGAVALISLVSSSGCKFVGTDYQAPQVAVPDAWNQHIIGSPVGVLAVDYWWKQFKDESMNQLIDAAIESNKSLAIAYERVLQPRILAVRFIRYGISKNLTFQPVITSGHFSCDE